MTNNLKKSLFVGLAALSFVSVASATNASAKSYAKVTSNNTLTTDPTTRNFESTGSNALMTKAGTVKGAKTVASKATMKSLMNSKSSKNYFRAYREATTNRGTKYYKVVSMDKKYRGWIYVGGVKSANTTTEAALPSQTKNYYLANPSKNTIWDNPQFTQYKAKKVGLTSFSNTDTFTVDKAETKTREGSLYYHVTSDKNSNLSGWIYAGNGKDNLGGLTTTKPSAQAADYNSVKVNFVNNNGATVGSTTYVNSSVQKPQNNNANENVAFDQTNGNTNFGKQLFNNVPSGYKLNDGTEFYSPKDGSRLTYTGTKASEATVKSSGQLQYGSTVSVKVGKVSTSKISFYAYVNGVATKLNSSDLVNNKFPELTSTEQNDNLTTEDTTLDTTNANTNLFVSGKKLNTLYGNPYKDSYGNMKQKVYSFSSIQGTKEDNGKQVVNAGSDINAYYTVAEQDYDSSANNNSTGNSNYAN